MAQHEGGAIEVFATTAGGEVFSVREVGADKDNYGNAWVSRGGNVVPGSLAVIRKDGADHPDRVERLPEKCLYLFARGADGHLWFTHQLKPDGGDWSSWQSLKGDELMPQAVPVVTREARYGGLIVFVWSKDGTIRYGRTTPERKDRVWADWRQLDSATFKSNPAVVSKSSGPDPGLEVFAVGQDDAVWKIRQLDCP